VASLGTSQILRHLGIFGTATDIAASRRPKATAETASGTAAMTMDEHKEPVEKTLDHPPTVSLVSKEQAVKLLKPVRGGAKRVKGAVAPEGKSAPEDSLEGKFVDIVDLIPSVPSKGEFDVNKIKSSLYFFS
jgi:DNA-directed RNA polymerase, mitochondrial